MDKNKKKKDECIRMASKSHPGHFYLFNKETGDTQWLPIKKLQKTQTQKRDSPPKLSINKKSCKTPAQDRLKRLQHNLKSFQTKPHTSHKPSTTDYKANEQENRIEDEPSTSSAAKSLTKCSKIESKRSLAVSFSNQIDNSAKDEDFKPSVSDVPINLESSDSLKTSSHSISTPKLNDSAILETCKEVLPTKESTTNNNKVGDIQIIDDDNSSKLNNLRSGIVKKIKEICKLPFQMSKNLSDKKLLAKDEKSCTNFKATRNKIKLKQCSSNSAKKEAIMTLITGENGKSGNNSFTSTLKLDTPKNLNTPSYPRGSANSRLERLKQSLLLQQHEQHQPFNTTTISSTSNQVLNFSSEAHNNTSPRTTLPIGHYSSHNNSVHSANHIANDTTNDEVEIMDWQPISKEPNEESSPEPIFIIKKSKKLLLRRNNSNESQIMGDIIDTVNENLLRLSAENPKASPSNSEMWRKDCYYFIVDTNVLLRDVTFVEDLTKMKLCDTNGSVLYIPYSVLQELDKLKMRSGFQEGVKTRAVHAIKYLNSKFEKNSPHLHAQSALDERLHLVNINSADDSIINCCLQVKQHVPNLLLLTEDVNLRNKAICNNIKVSTKSDLTAKRYEANKNS